MVPPPAEEGGVTQAAYDGGSTGGSPPQAVGGDEQPVLARGVREELPNRRRTQVFKAHVGTSPSVFLHVDEYPDGRAGAIWIRVAKTGTFTNGVMDAFASAVSLALQFGTPLKAIADRMTGTIFEPNGMVVTDEGMSHATSIVDWIFQTLLKEYDHDHPHD